MSAEEIQESVTEARALVCSAMSDIGGVCERLRELEAQTWPAHAAPEAWTDISNWATQACETLGLITSVAAKHIEEGAE